MLAPLLAASLAFVGLSGCGSGRSDVIVDPAHVEPVASADPKATPKGAVRVMFELPRDGAPIEPGRTPWPTELARRDDGHIDLRGYPGHDSALLSEYLDRAAEDLDGFSIAPVAYFRFEGPIDLGDAPEKDASRSIQAPIVLADVDPASPERGTLYPLERRGFSRDMRYLRKGTLAVRPLDGFVLRPGTLYAAAVRRSFGDVPGGLGTSLDLETVLAKTPRTEAVAERARAVHAPAVEALESLGLPRSEIAAIAVFRTGNPHAMISKLVGAVDAMFANNSYSTPASDKASSGTKGAAAGDKASGGGAAASGGRRDGEGGGKATRAKDSNEERGASHAPKIVRAEWDGGLSKPGLYRVIRGAYCTPNFQSRVENAPYLEREGGRVLLDAAGEPLVAPIPRDSDVASRECPGQIRARFVLSVPESAAPKEGYPLLVTAHGTGGDAMSFLGESDFAGWAAREGYAAISTDQPLNGGKEGNRPGAAGDLVLPLGIPVPQGEGGPFLAFYNPLHPGATGGNMHQAQADAAVLVRLFGGLDFATARDDKKRAVLKGKGPLPRFDAKRTALAGHSQGCQSMAALGAVDPRARGVILSGCGGDVRIGLLRRRLINVTSWISLLLGLDPDELTESHPLLALVQNMADPIDPIAFGRYYWDPLPGRAPRKVLHIEGLHDSYNPPSAAEALAVAMRAESVGALLRPVEGLALLGAVSTPDRKLIQIDPPPGVDGHFVLYEVPRAQDALREFLRTIAPP